ncbi:MAG: hypothetical protein ACI4NM_11435, partial [Bullifex sp.]
GWLISDGFDHLNFNRTGRFFFEFDGTLLSEDVTAELTLEKTDYYPPVLDISASGGFTVTAEGESGYIVIPFRTGCDMKISDDSRWEYCPLTLETVPNTKGNYGNCLRPTMEKRASYLKIFRYTGCEEGTVLGSVTEGTSQSVHSHIVFDYDRGEYVCQDSSCGQVMNIAFFTQKYITDCYGGELTAMDVNSNAWITDKYGVLKIRKDGPCAPDCKLPFTHSTTGNMDGSAVSTSMWNENDKSSQISVTFRELFYEGGKLVKVISDVKLFSGISEFSVYKNVVFAAGTHEHQFVLNGNILHCDSCSLSLNAILFTCTSSSIPVSVEGLMEGEYASFYGKDGLFLINRLQNTDSYVFSGGQEGFMVVIAAPVGTEPVIREENGIYRISLKRP